MTSPRIVAITGVCGGLGQAMAKHFMDKNWHVIGLDYQTAALDTLEEEYRSQFSPFICDLTDRRSFQTVCTQLYDEFGAPDVWINNAGIAQNCPFSEMTLENIDRLMQINFGAVVQACSFWLPLMETRGSGKIVNIASVAGHASAPYLSSYVASKHAVVGLTESLQIESQHKQSHVQFILVSPGFVDTKIVRCGEKRGFPERLRFILEDANRCSKRIVEGIIKGEPFIEPTFNGRLMLRLHRYAPELAKRAPRVLAAKTLKQLLGVEKIDF